VPEQDATMKRRDLLTGLATAMVVRPRMIRAQANTFRLGTLNPVAAMTDTSPFGKALISVLADRGYVIGRSLLMDARGAAGDVGKIPGLLQELKAQGADALVIAGYPTAVVAKSLGVPTVAALGLGDPVATGLIQSLAHPGGNITGISDVASELSAKRLSLLTQLSPRLTKVAMLWNKDDLGMTLRYDASARAARALGVTVQPLGVREPDDFNEAFAAMDGDRPDAILMVADALTNLNRKRVFEFAATRKLPAIYEYDFLARDGGLMSYGPDVKESFEQAADLVDRIFKGAKPGDLPFEQPTRYPLVLNLQTAKAMGLDVPPTLLALADEVIE
jgi:putative tryptophan/tyrosine transport system substrate-binding protein